jgi:adenosylhomocysteine nucleosidase
MMIGIIGAMPEEIELLLATLKGAQTLTRGPFTLHRGELVGQQVLIAQCGIGKVNAAALTQLLIVEGATPIIFSGVAGALSPEVQVGDIVISSDCLQHDIDVTALEYPPGQIPGEALAWSADPRLIDIARASASEFGVTVWCGRVLSGDQFIADSAKVAALHRQFDALCTEMEGAAVAQVCSKWQVPFVVIRSISDSADQAATTDFRSFVQLAAQRAKQVVLGMLSAF